MRTGTEVVAVAAQLLHDLMARSSDLTSEEKQRLAQYLSEQVNNGDGEKDRVSPPVPRSDPRKGQLSVAWLKAHAQEYAGQHVALEGDQLVGSGRTMRDALSAAKQNGHPRALLVHVPPREGGAWGGW
jgi:hypothetical protein